jgi:hypothetical protein
MEESQNPFHLYSLSPQSPQFQTFNRQQSTVPKIRFLYSQKWNGMTYDLIPNSYINVYVNSWYIPG